MYIKILFFLTAIAVASGQVIECTYFGTVDYPDNYHCSLFIVNLNGFDGFTSIPGDHIEGGSNDLVSSIGTDQAWTTILPSVICRQFKNLKRFDFYSQYDYDVTNLSLENCFNLNYLYLSRVKSIESQAFRNLNYVTMLSLYEADGIIIEIPQNLFSLMGNLESLRLGLTSSDFHPLTFKELKLLKYVSLSGNFTTWHREWFSELDHLVSIDVVGHGYKEIPLNAIKTVSSLRIVSETLEFIDGGSFGSLENLDSITLECKNLNAIDSRIFTQPRLLGSVNFYTACIEALTVYDFYRHVEGYLILLETCTNNFNYLVVSE